MGMKIETRQGDYDYLKERSKVEGRPMAAIFSDAIEALKIVSEIKQVTGIITEDDLRLIQETCGHCEDRQCMKMSSIVDSVKQKDRADKLEAIIMQQSKELARLRESEAQGEIISAIVELLNKRNFKMK